MPAKENAAYLRTEQRLDNLIPRKRLKNLSLRLDIPLNSNLEHALDYIYQIQSAIESSKTGLEYTHLSAYT